MHLKSLDGCQLTIGSYPTFFYNACGGGGKGTLRQDENKYKPNKSKKKKHLANNKHLILIIN